MLKEVDNFMISLDRKNSQTSKDLEEGARNPVYPVSKHRVMKVVSGYNIGDEDSVVAPVSGNVSRLKADQRGVIRSNSNRGSTVNDSEGKDGQNDPKIQPKQPAVELEVPIEFSDDDVVFQVATIKPDSLHGHEGSEEAKQEKHI